MSDLTSTLLSLQHLVVLALVLTNIGICYSAKGSISRIEASTARMERALIRWIDWQMGARSAPRDD